MSRQLKRQIERARVGRGVEASPARPRPARTPDQRLNRILLIGGVLLALGAVVVAIITPPFDATRLAINLGAIGLGLLMGKGFGRFLFRRVLPTTNK